MAKLHFRYGAMGSSKTALALMMAYNFREKGMKRVYASFFAGNEPSRRVMEKCGMRFSRFSEKELSYLGVERDLIYYAIDKEEGGE